MWLAVPGVLPKPRPGEVYNLGGGRANSISVLETISALEQMGHKLEWTYRANRIGDHICYISDLTKLKQHYPEWRLEHSIANILQEMVERHHDARPATV